MQEQGSCFTQHEDGHLFTAARRAELIPLAQPQRKVWTRLANCSSTRSLPKPKTGYAVVLQPMEKQVTPLRTPLAGQPLPT